LRRTIFIRGGRDACVDAVTSRRSIRRRCAVARSDGVDTLFPGRFEGLSHSEVAFPTTETGEYVPNLRGWGVSSSSSTSKIRKVYFISVIIFTSFAIKPSLGVVSFDFLGVTVFWVARVEDPEGYPEFARRNSATQAER